MPSPLLSENLKIKIQDYNFACGSVWVWNFHSDIKGGTQTEGVKENIWTAEGWSDGRVKKAA
jgi:hypothetical protein